MNSFKKAFAAAMLGAASMVGLATAPQAEAQGYGYGHGWGRPPVRHFFNPYAHEGYGRRYYGGQGIGPVAGGLLGFGAGVAIGRALGGEEAPVYAAPPPVYYNAPPPVYYNAPPPVYYAPAPPPPPVYYTAPPDVVQAPPPVIYAAPPQDPAYQACVNHNTAVQAYQMKNFGYEEPQPPCPGGP
jgi:hypothetical protein